MARNNTKTKSRRKTTAAKRSRGAAKTGRIRAPRNQSARSVTRRPERDERAAELRREISRKLAEGRKLRRDIEARIDRMLRERP